MKYGLKPQYWNSIETLVLQPLREAGCEVYVFGSRARGDNKPFSDLDLFFKGSPAEALLVKIKNNLEESNLPIKVDVVNFKDLPQSFLPSIEKEKIKI